MILGLHGRLQAGKDTTFTVLSQMLEGMVPVERLSFADPLKDSAAALLGVSREELEYLKLSPLPNITVRVPLSDHPNEVRYRTVNLTGREYLQRYGTESHRDVFGDSFWVDLALDKATDPRTLYVITDVRFENEAVAISHLGGRIVHVVGPQGKTAGGHASEAQLPEWLLDYELDNGVRGDGFAHLNDQVSVLVATLDLEGMLA